MSCLRAWAARGGVCCREFAHDLGIRNGQIQHVFDVISFEIQTRDQLKDSIEARKWAIADTRAMDSELPIGVLVIGESKAGELFAGTRTVYQELGATVITEDGMDDYLKKAAARAIDRAMRVSDAVPRA